MKTLKLKAKEINVKDWVGKEPSLSHAKRFIDKDTLVLGEDGEPRILYVKIPEDTQAMTQRLFDVQYNSVNRAAGITTYSAVFGYTPRVALRRDFCNVSRLTSEQPEVNKILHDFASTLLGYYEKYFPKVLKYHQDKAKDIIKPEWRMHDTPFTSGIINFNSAIKYHLDAGNIRDCASNMILLTRNIEGGDFVVPEYDLALKNQNNYLFIFDGQAILHGVTPLKLIARNSFRISIVWYTLEQMWRCLTIKEELSRANTIKSKRLIEKAQRMKDANS